MTMRNLWAQTDNPFATWVADLTPLRSQPESLLRFILDVLEEGARYQVLKIIEAPLLGYTAEHGGELGPLLSKLYQEHHVVDLFGFTGAAMAPGHPQSSTAQATLSWYDVNGRVVEGACTDLGALLARFEPAPDAFPLDCLRHYPPVRVTGRRLEYPPGSREPKNAPLDWPPEVRFSIHSDIWFPWCFGLTHPEFDYKRMFDNRELAGRHTPRLNAFLEAVEAKTLELGGSWQIDSDEIGTGMSPWLTAHGIDLETEPLARMPAAALDTEWV
jgi:hypothetical protein